MSSDIDKFRLAGEVLGQALGSLFGSKKDSLVADSTPPFGYESPYYKGHPSFKTPSLRTADFVYGWDDDRPLVETGGSGGMDLPVHGFGDMNEYGLPKDMPIEDQLEVLRRYPIK
tara:strand:- start:2397 stop:2741 length:345 start_codon:yes stop_codon:yes gene_type:complete